MTVERFLHTIDGISTWVGKAAAWLIIALMAVVCLEVFKRYLLNAPTAWIFDLNNMLYGSLFMLCGAYALAQNAHVRGDFLYSSMRPRTQATLDLVLYFVFFFPASPPCSTPAGNMPVIRGAFASTPTSPPMDRRSITSRPSSRLPAHSCCCRASPKWCAASSA